MNNLAKVKKKYFYLKIFDTYKMHMKNNFEIKKL